MDINEFHAMADQAMQAIEMLLEAQDADFDWVSDGVLEIHAADSGEIIVVNKQAAAQEIWLAAKSGGRHFRWDAAKRHWADTRSGLELSEAIQRCLAEWG